MSLPDSSVHLSNAASTISRQNLRVHDHVLCALFQFYMIREMNGVLAPIQIAVMNGLAEAVEELMAANPLSFLVLTAAGETLFHLAVKNSQLDVFQVLLKKIHLPMIRKRLLNWQDKEGNTILHLAISNKQVKILKLLVPENSTSDDLVGVNLPNKKGLTALDLICGEDDRQARAVTVTPLPAPPPPPPRGVHLELMYAKLALVAAIIGIVCNIPSSLSTGDAGEVVLAADVLTGRLPPILYLMVFINVVFGYFFATTVREMWNETFKPVLVFMSITVCFVYALLVDHVIPKFWVRIGSLNFVSSIMVWLLSGAYVASFAIVFAVSYGFRYLIRLIKPLISKKEKKPCFDANPTVPLPPSDPMTRAKSKDLQGKLSQLLYKKLERETTIKEAILREKAPRPITVLQAAPAAPGDCVLAIPDQ